MSLKNGVKQLLRMCGHAFVSTVHDHLSDVDQQLSQMASQLGELKAAADNLAESECALLQGGIRTLEDLKGMRSEFRRGDAVARQRLDEVDARWRELLGAVQSVCADNGHQLARVEDCLARSHQYLSDSVARLQDQLNRTLEKQAEAVTSHQLERVEHHLTSSQQTLSDAVAQLRDGLTQFQNHLTRTMERQSELVENELVRQVYVESDEYEAVNPETGLLTFLYSHLPTRKALDVGAHVGDVSDRLLRAGYEVFAFEPSPAVYETLKHNLEGRKDFTAFQLALGSSEGEALLHLATDLSEAKYYQDPSLLSSLITHSMPAEIPFTQTVPVMVKTISGLQRSGLIPQDLALVKIDTEGFDLEVVRGMSEPWCPVIATEYFDVRHPFGQSGLLYTLDTLIGEMRERGYFWHIVMHRDWHCKHTAYYCNHERSVPGTWGNAVFFRDHDLFSHAQSWCSAVLPMTYFKAMRPVSGDGEREP